MRGQSPPVAPQGRRPEELPSVPPKVELIINVRIYLCIKVTTNWLHYYSTITLTIILPANPRRVGLVLIVILAHKQWVSLTIITKILS